MFSNMSVCHFSSQLSSTHLSSYSHAHISIIIIVTAPAVRACIVTIMHTFQAHTIHKIQCCHVMYAYATKESRQTSTCQRNLMHILYYYIIVQSTKSRVKATAKVHICKRNTCIVVCLAHHKINIIYCDGFESERRLTIFLFVPKNRCVHCIYRGGRGTGGDKETYACALCI